MSLTISAGVASDTGRVRTVNEDSWCLVPRLYAVADGMGGHAAGDRASRIAVEALRRVGESGAFQGEDIRRCLAEANAAMIAEADERQQERSMGTTVVGVAVVPFAGSDHWLAFNIGDSRAYQFTGGRLEQISVDHSEVQELIDAGRIRPADAASHPRRNVVTRSLGSLDAEAADTWLLPMAADQTLLLCSDGLTLEVPEPEIARLLSDDASPARIAQSLVDAAVSAGGRDNVTALVVRTGVRGDHDLDDTNPAGRPVPATDDRPTPGPGGHDDGF